MTVNKELLRETLDAVIAADAVGDWIQQAWLISSWPVAEGSCGTAGCFAGWRAMLDGYTQVSRTFSGTAINPTTFERIEVRSHAVQRLGLTDRQSVRLFAASNTLADLKDIVDDICEGRV
jgi:hypothetical protein